jgi:hypothetical protein
MSVTTQTVVDTIMFHTPQCICIDLYCMYHSVEPNITQDKQSEEYITEIKGEDTKDKIKQIKKEIKPCSSSFPSSLFSSSVYPRPTEMCVKTIK